MYGDNKMNIAGNLLIMLSIIFIQACSSRGVYDSTQYSERIKCLEAPNSEYDECMERTRESYDIYKEKRDEVVKDN